MIDRLAHSLVMKRAAEFKSALRDGSSWDILEDRFYDVFDVIAENSGGHYDFYNVMDLEMGDHRPKKAAMPSRPGRVSLYPSQQCTLTTTPPPHIADISGMG